MERFLSQIFRYIPEWMFVAVILVGALAYFMYDKPLYKLCDAQISEFSRSQKGKLLGRLSPARKKCINSIRGSGCVEYFQIFESVVASMPKLQEKCLIELAETPMISLSFGQYLRTMVQLAWGDRPPGTQFEKVGWLKSSDLKTFCRVREFYNMFYPQEQWNALVSSTLGLLVEDPATIPKTRVQRRLSEIDANEAKDAEEDDKYYFRKAKMKPDRAFTLSLFSLDCLPYQ